MGFARVADAVIELGHRARRGTAAKRRQAAEYGAKALETAALFGNGDGEQCLSFFADLSAFGNKAQAVEIDIRTAQHRSISLALGFVLRHVFFDAGHRHGTRGLDDVARVDKHIFDGGANFIGVYANKFVHQVFGNAKSFLTHQFHGCAVGKQADIVQRHAFTGFHRLHHGV